MMKKCLIALLTMMVLIGTLTGCGNNGEAEPSNDDGDVGPATGEQVRIQIAHDNTTETPAHKAFVEFKEMVEERSSGEIEVVLFPGGQLGSVQDTLEQTRRGDIEMSVGATTLFTSTIPEFAVWDSFYMFDDASHAHRVLDGHAGKELMKPLENMGLTGMGYMEIGFRNLSNSVRPVETLEDVQGLRLRGYNPIQIKAWESIGASMTSVDWAEVFTSLQQNLIDGQESATESFYSARFYEAQDYLSMTKHIYTNFLWYANNEFLENLSDEHRTIVEEAAAETIALQRQFVAEAEGEIIDKLLDEGIQINEVSTEERLRMGEVMNSAIEEDIVEMCGQDLYDLVMEQLEAER